MKYLCALLWYDDDGVWISQMKGCMRAHSHAIPYDLNDIIYNELCLGVISNESKQQYLDIIGDLVKSGVQGVILGCTEIGLLIKQDDTDIPLFDTTLIHAKNAALISIGRA